MHKYFWQPIGKLKEKLIENYAFCKNATYLNQFSNKTGAIGKPERPKKHPIWAAHPRTHLSTKYPPGDAHQRETITKWPIWLALTKISLILVVCARYVYELFLASKICLISKFHISVTLIHLILTGVMSFWDAKTLVRTLRISQFNKETNT